MVCELCHKHHRIKIRQKLSIFWLASISLEFAVFSLSLHVNQGWKSNRGPTCTIDTVDIAAITCTIDILNSIDVSDAVYATDMIDMIQYVWICIYTHIVLSYHYKYIYIYMWQGPFGIMRPCDGYSTFFWYFEHATYTLSSLSVVRDERIVFPEATLFLLVVLD